MAVQIHDTFSDLVDTLRDTSKANGEALQKGTDGQWMAPEGWKGPANIAEMDKPGFDRDAIGENYQDMHLGDGADDGVGAAASLKVQLDYVGGAERAFRLRHASRVRCFFHEAARWQAHGHPDGVIAAARNYAQDLAQTGGEGGKS